MKLAGEIASGLVFALPALAYKSALFHRQASQPYPLHAAEQNEHNSLQDLKR